VIAEDLVRSRVEQYLVDRRAYSMEVGRLLRAAGHRDEGSLAPTAKLSSDIRAAWERCKEPHVTPDHQAGIGPTKKPDVNWATTRIVKVEIKGASATVTTEEAIQDAAAARLLGPETLEYRLRRLDGEWRIHQRRLLNLDPPPKWIGYLL
jgi:hypothetical protein